MTRYKHLSITERESILAFLAQGLSKRAIAVHLRRSASTISRELRRNLKRDAPLRYSPSIAQWRYRWRRRNCHRRYRLADPATREKILHLLTLYWSPEQISARLKHEQSAVQIGACTIYRGYKRKQIPKEYRQYFRYRPYRKPGKEKRTGKLTPPHTIHERPQAATLRTELGHMEADSLRGKKNAGGLATFVDRKSRLLRAALLRDATSETYMQASVSVLRGLPLHTITNDNGKEFARYDVLMRELGVEVYFCDPNAPWQRGSNENTNGLLRQFYPKGFNFSKISQEDVLLKVALINRRPRKVLGWLCPDEVSFADVLHLT